MNTHFTDREVIEPFCSYCKGPWDEAHKKNWRHPSEGENMTASRMKPISLDRIRTVMDLPAGDAIDVSGVYFSSDEHSIRIRQDHWEDMGKPEHVTVAIWPGDRQDLMETEDFPE